MNAPPGTPQSSPPTPQNLRRRIAMIRVVVLVVIVSFGYGLAVHFGVLEHLTKENVRGWMTEAGWQGVTLYMLAFVVGNLLQLPSNVFIAAAVLSFGFLPGWAVGYATNTLSVCVSFAFVRTVGGRALDTIERPWVRRALNRLDTHPIRTVALLRAVFAGAPWLNYLLSMSNVRLRDYAIGSAMGLAPHLFVICAAVAWFLEM